MLLYPAAVQGAGSASIQAVPNLPADSVQHAQDKAWMPVKSCCTQTCVHVTIIGLIYHMLCVWWNHVRVVEPRAAVCLEQTQMCCKRLSRDVHSVCRCMPQVRNRGYSSYPVLLGMQPFSIAVWSMLLRQVLAVDQMLICKVQQLCQALFPTPFLTCMQAAAQA